jgi:diguanylate cyclase (GGDEF)-like protein
VLVVDDRKENLVAISAILENSNYSVVAAGSGAEALKQLADQDFALILLDLHMPILDGLDTAKLIRERPGSKDTPIIFITAHDHEEHLVYEAYDRGAVDYISQPINARILKCKVDIFVEFFLQKEELRKIRASLENEIQEKITALKKTNEELIREIAIRERVEQKLLHESSHDGLTGLPNRTLFLRALMRCFQGLRRDPAYRFAVLFIDVDNFKRINDQYGHSIGDDVLIETAHRLEYAVRPGDYVARFAGDEFGILLDRVGDDVTAEAITKRVLTQFEKPFVQEKGNLQVTISAGITLFSGDFETPEQMVHSADEAMYAAKNAGKAGYSFGRPQQSGSIRPPDGSGTSAPPTF